MEVHYMSTCLSRCPCKRFLSTSTPHCGTRVSSRFFLSSLRF